MKSNGATGTLIALYFALTGCAGIALTPQSVTAVVTTILHLAY